MKSFISIIVLSISLFASSYLECKAYRVEDNKLVTFSLKLDEDASKITFSSDDKSYIDNGYFAPSVIRFSSIKEVSSGSMKREIEINRENLSMKMALSLWMGREWQSPTLFKGKCDIKQNKNKI